VITSLIDQWCLDRQPRGADVVGEWSQPVSLTPPGGPLKRCDLSLGSALFECVQRGQWSAELHQPAAHAVGESSAGA